MDTIEYLNGEVKKGHFFSFIVLLHDFRNRVYEKCEGSGRTERKVVQGWIKCVFPIAADQSHIQ